MSFPEQADNVRPPGSKAFSAEQTNDHQFEEHEWAQHLRKWRSENVMDPFDAKSDMGGYRCDRVFRIHSIQRGKDVLRLAAALQNRHNDPL